MASERFLLGTHGDPEEGVLSALWDDGARDFEATAFQSPLFLRSFYRNLPENCRPLVLSVVDNTSGKLAMAVPLLLRRRGRFRSIEAADLGLSDYVGPIMARWFHPSGEEMTAIWSKARRALPPADILTLRKIPTRINRERENPMALLPGAVEMGTGTKTLDLYDENSRDHYRRSAIYKEAMRKLQKLRKQGTVEYRVVTTREAAYEQYEHTLAQRIARFEALNRYDPLTQPEVRTFYREVISEGVVSGRVFYGGLYLDGECVATDTGFVHDDLNHGVLTTIKSGDIGRFSPGTISFMLTLDHTRALGIRYYNRGVGEFGYKQRLAGEPMPLFEWHAALSLRGRIAVAEARARRFVRKGIARYPSLRAPAEAIDRKLSELRR